MHKLRALIIAFLLALSAGRADAQTNQPPASPDGQAVACVVGAILSGGLSPSQAVCFLKLFASLKPPAGQAASPEPQTVAFPASIAEVGEMIAKCYHPTGQFQAARALEHPWRAQHEQWNATDSALLDIRYRGALSGTQYAMLVGLIERDGAIRAVIQEERSAFPPSPNCALKNWVRLAR